jgi:hypothetical protein
MTIAHRTTTFLSILIAAAVIPSVAWAVLQLPEITRPEQLPAGLTIQSKLGDDGMIHFNVYVDVDAIVNSANPELYKGRISSHGVLKIATAQETIASVALQGSPERKTGGRTWYQFSIAPSALGNSELQLVVQRFEKDGMVTIGGGTTMQIKLAGFEPKAKADTKPDK